MFTFRNQRDVERKQDGIVMNQAEHTEFIAKLVVEFGNLSPNELAVLAAEAQANFDPNVED